MEALTKELEKFQAHAKAQKKTLPENNFAAAFTQLIQAIDKKYQGQPIGPADYITIIQAPENATLKWDLIKIEGDDAKTKARIQLFDDTMKLMLVGEQQHIPDQVLAPKDPQEKLWGLLAKTAESSKPDDPFYPDTAAAIKSYVEHLQEQAAPRKQAPGKQP